MNSALSVAFLAIPLFLTDCASTQQNTELRLGIGDSEADVCAVPDFPSVWLQIDCLLDAGADVRLQWRAFATDGLTPRVSFSLPIRSSDEIHAAIGGLRFGRERFHLSAIPLSISQGTSVASTMINVEPGDYGLVGHWRAGEIARESGDTPTKLAQSKLWRDPLNLETLPDWRIELVMLVDAPSGEPE